MVSPARKRRAWILLLLTWAVIAGVFATRYMANARAERQRFDREAQEQAALRAMDKMAAESPDAEATDPQTAPPSSAPSATPSNPPADPPADPANPPADPPTPSPSPAEPPTGG